MMSTETLKCPDLKSIFKRSLRADNCALLEIVEAAAQKVLGMDDELREKVIALAQSDPVQLAERAAEFFKK